MTLVLDSGAFIALERNDRGMWRRFKDAWLSGTPPVTHGGVIGQVWRGQGPRQALLARAIAHVDVRSLDESLGRGSGVLLAASDSEDVIDAALVLLAQDGDSIITSDPFDLEPLAVVAGRHVELIRI